MFKIIAFFILVAVYYLVGAAVAWEIDPMNWNQYWRGFIVFFDLLTFYNLIHQLAKDRSKKNAK